MGRKTVYTASLAIAVTGALQAHAVPLVCGGVGSDERRELAAVASGASLSMQFSLAGRGNYIADVDVLVTPEKGEAFSARTDGPLCYVQLPPGRYRVDATYNGTRKSANVIVPAVGGKAARLAMSFPPGPGDLDPAPVSPEEKLQASKP